MIRRSSLFFLLSLVLWSPLLWAIDEEVPIILRNPASEDAPISTLQAHAHITAIINDNLLKAESTGKDWFVGQMLIISSQNRGVGIVGFIEVTGISAKGEGNYELTCTLLRQSRVHFILVGDDVSPLNLSTSNDTYKGNTDLLVKNNSPDVSAKYKPLFTQGVAVGQTAQTLWPKEYLVTWYGEVNYGVKDWLTVSTIVPGDLLNAENAATKFRMYNSDFNTVAMALNYTNIEKDHKGTLNLTFYWDAISSGSVISHTLISLALFSFENASDVTAIKTLGTSSFQSGYELVLDNWDRVLGGPSYNFDNKAVGGYLTYVKIWDRFHASVSLNSTNISMMRLSPVNGYYAAADAYWRF